MLNGRYPFSYFQMYVCEREKRGDKLGTERERERTEPAFFSTPTRCVRFLALQQPRTVQYGFPVVGLGSAFGGVSGLACHSLRPNRIIEYAPARQMMVQRTVFLESEKDSVDERGGEPTPLPLCPFLPRVCFFCHSCPTHTLLSPSLFDVCFEVMCPSVTYAHELRTRGGRRQALLSWENFGWPLFLKTGRLDYITNPPCLKGLRFKPNLVDYIDFFFSQRGDETTGAFVPCQLSLVSCYIRTRNNTHKLRTRGDRRPPRFPVLSLPRRENFGWQFFFFVLWAALITTPQN